MKKLLLVITILSFCLPKTIKASPAGLPGTAVLSATVLDKKNSIPLAGASISIPDLKLTAIADSAGSFTFTKLPVGTFLIEIKFEGYKTLAQTVTLKTQPIKVTFYLEPSVEQINEVVVTGTSKASQIKRSPVPIVSINKEYLVTNLNTNAIDAIAKVPGVRALTTGPNVSKPFIRGLGYNRILTLYDGSRQEGQQWGDEHGIEVDQYSIERVEVIKGPASLSYGSDALAGVVNLIPTPMAPEGKFVGNATIDYQSNNKMIGGSVLLSSTKNGFEWLVRASHKGFWYRLQRNRCQCFYWIA